MDVSIDESFWKVETANAAGLVWLVQYVEDDFLSELREAELVEWKPRFPTHKFVELVRGPKLRYILAMSQ
ncbi:unnamed protein product [Protopolystoma xenopodis]|uniref:Uncharacterized protein n=1 Tax=Protopolystoma xenopodis TaxID=117903 RepID=A0A3S5BCV9_9PLAT|nr:unnamed protein product [Protopolystoma xenopodis]